MIVLRTTSLFLFLILAASQTPVFPRLVRDWDRTMFVDNEHRRMLADMFSAFVLFPVFTLMAIWRCKLGTPPRARSV
jgi:hypothetical protein